MHRAIDGGAGLLSSATTATANADITAGNGGGSGGGDGVLLSTAGSALTNNGEIRGGRGGSGGSSVMPIGAGGGAGVLLNGHVTLGAAVSSLWTGTNGGGSSVSGNSVGVYGYGIYTAGRFEASALAGVGHLGDSTARFLAGVATGTAASNGDFTDVGARAQYSFGDPFGFVAPYVSGEYLHTGLGRASETGLGAFDLSYGAMHTDLGQFGGGVMPGFAINTRFGTLTPWSGLARALVHKSWTLLKIYLYGYLNRAQSSRRLASRYSLIHALGDAVLAAQPFAE